MGNSTSISKNKLNLFLLPPELIDLVLSYISIQDFIAFIVTCKRFSSHSYFGSNYPHREKQLNWLLDLPPHPKVEKILLTCFKFTYFCRDTLLIRCCKLNYPSLLTKILIPSLNVDAALSFSAKNGRNATLKILLLHGGNPNLTDEIDRSILEYAVRSQSLETVKLLLENNAVVNVQDVGHATPLRTAASLGLESVVQILLDFGAIIDDTDPDGYSALTWSILYGRKEVATLLIDGGGDTKIKARDGTSLSEIARRYGHESISDRLGLD